MLALSRALGFKWVVLVGLLASLQTTAQVRSFKHFGLDKSIFPSRIECVDQASDGTLLVGTLAGLVVYDGFEFKNIGVSDGLSESSISSLSHFDDFIFVGHWAGNISVITGDDGAISHWRTDEIVGFSSIVQMHPFGQDSLWALTRDGRLYELTKEHGARLAIPVLQAEDKILQFEVRDETVYILTQKKIFVGVLGPNGLKWSEVFSLSSDKDELRCILVSKEEVFVGSNSGLQVFEKAFKLKASLSLPYPATEICPDGLGIIWISTDENGVYQLDPHSLELTSLKRENGLSYNQVRDLFLDREQNLWIATAAGLDQYLGDAFTLYDQRSGLQGTMVWDVLTSENNVFALTSRGLSVFEISVDNAHPSFQYFVPAMGSEPRRLVGDAQVGLWMIDFAGVLWRLDIEKRLFVKTGWLTDQEPISCMEFVNGDIWLGTENGVFVIQDGRIAEHLTVQSGLAGNRITGIYYSKRLNQTWITALGAKASLFAEGKLRKFGPDEGLTTSVIQDADFDLAGRVWFASYDKGVFYMNDQEMFVSLAAEHQLTSNTTFALEIDKQGTIWIGHNWGVDAYQPSTKTYKWYGEDDGFMGLEVNAGSMDLCDNEGIWMGTLMGLLRFDVGKVKVNNRPPSLRVTKAFLGENNLFKDLDAHFQSDGSDFSLEFKSVSLTNVSRNRYYYRVRGIHENWRELEKPSKIEYLSLPIGSYIFELSACNNSGICTEQPYTMNFTIVPPFYKTWWFYSLLFFAVVASILLMDKYRVVQLIDQKNKVEEVLALRDQQLMDLQEEGSKMNRYWSAQLDMLKTLHDLAGHTNPFQHWPRADKLEIGISDLNAVGTVNFYNESFQFSAIVDVSVGGPVAQVIRLSLQRAVDLLFQDEMPDQKRVLRTWISIVDETDRHFAKFQGVRWLLFLKAGDKWLMSAKDIFVIKLVQNQVKQLMITENDWIEMPSCDKLVVFNKGIFQLLNASGTKTYTMADLIHFFEMNAGLSAGAMLDTLKTDLLSWKGSMEQEDDISVYILSNET